MNKIFTLLDNDNLFRETMAKVFKYMDIDDIYATYSPKIRKERLLREQYIIDYYDGDVDTSDLLENEKQFFSNDINVAELHRHGSTRLDYLLSATKSVLRVYEEILSNSSINKQDVVKFIVNLRRIQDVRELVTVKNWYKGLMEDVKNEVDRLQVQVKQQTSRIDKLLNTIEHPVVIMGAKGEVLELNEAAVSYFALWNLHRPMDILGLLDFHFSSFEDFRVTYDEKPVRQLGFTNGDQVVSKLSRLDKYSYILSLIPINQDESPTEHPELSRAENIVFEHVNQGMSTKQIAEKLNLSEETVKTHRKQIRRKLGLVNRKTSIQKYVFKNR